MIGNLINYYSVNSDNIVPIQVYNPESHYNTDFPYEFEEDENLIYKSINNNRDRINGDNINKRLMYPDLQVYTREFIKLQIKEFLGKYDYESILRLTGNLYDQNHELIALLRYADARQKLKGEIANKILDEINENEKYNDIYYFDKEKFNNNNNNNSQGNSSKINIYDPQIEPWYKIVDYYALAKIKLEIGDVTGYILMIDTLNFQIYFTILQHIRGFKFNRLFLKNDSGYVYNHRRMRKDGNISKEIKSKLIPKGKDVYYVNIKGLSTLIRWYINNSEKMRDIFSEAYFIRLHDYFLRTKFIRNKLAHTFLRIDQNEFKNNSDLTINELNRAIENFFETYYKPHGYKKQMSNVYENINNYIIDILDKVDE